MIFATKADRQGHFRSFFMARTKLCRLHFYLLSFNDNLMTYVLLQWYMVDDELRKPTIAGWSSLNSFCDKTMADGKKRWKPSWLADKRQDGQIRCISSSTHEHATWPWHVNMTAGIFSTLCFFAQLCFHHSHSQTGKSLKKQKLDMLLGWIVCHYSIRK